MILDQIATRPVAVVNPGDTLNRAIQYMWRLGAEHLPVVEKGQIIGMLAERDLLIHACGDPYAANNLVHVDLKDVTGTSRVDAVMTKPVITLSPNESVEEAGRIMLHKSIHAIPLTRGEAMCGIVTETDLLKSYLDTAPVDHLGGLPLEPVVEHMSTHVFSVAPDDAKPKVIRLMRDKRIHHVPVVGSNGKLLGILAESDVLLGQKIDRPVAHLTLNSLVRQTNMLASELMATPPLTVELNTSLREAAQQMVDNRIGCLPVVKDDQLTGILTSTDLVRNMVQASV